MASVKTSRKRVQMGDSLRSALVLFRMTSDRFCELPVSATVKLELLNGEVVAMPRPRRNHQYFIFRLGLALAAWCDPRNLGRVLPDMLMKLNGLWTSAP